MRNVILVKLNPYQVKFIKWKQCSSFSFFYYLFIYSTHNARKFLFPFCLILFSIVISCYLFLPPFFLILYNNFLIFYVCMIFLFFQGIILCVKKIDQFLWCGHEYMIFISIYTHESLHTIYHSELRWKKRKEKKKRKGGKKNKKIHEKFR